jgi:hypothetical protein
MFTDSVLSYVEGRGSDNRVRTTDDTEPRLRSIVSEGGSCGLDLGRPGCRAPGYLALPACNYRAAAFAPGEAQAILRRRSRFALYMLP